MHSIPKLIEAARLFEIPHMHDDCLAFWRSNLTPERCLELRKLAQASGNQDAEKAAEDFNRSNLEKVVLLPSFLRIDQDDFLHYISDANYETYWKAVSIYCQGQGENFLKLLNRLNLLNFPLEFLCTTVLADPVTNYKLPETRLLVARAVFSDLTRLENQINLKNCFVLKKLLSLTYDPIARGIIDLFIEKNIMSIICERGFCFLSEQDVLCLLKNTDIKPEESKWEAILNWLHGGARSNQCREISLSQMVGCIKLEKLPFDFLKKIFSEENVKRDAACMSLLTQAILDCTERMHAESGYGRLSRSPQCEGGPFAIPSKDQIQDLQPKLDVNDSSASLKAVCDSCKDDATSEDKKALEAGSRSDALPGSGASRDKNSEQFSSKNVGANPKILATASRSDHRSMRTPKRHRKGCRNR